jgi:hypothetical protein
MDTEFTLTEYFVARTFNVNDIYTFVIAYSSKDDQAYYELLDSPHSNPELIQMVDAQPELMEERWVYLLNQGDYIFVDRYEKNIMSNSLLFTREGQPIVDDTIVEKAVKAIIDATKDDEARLEKLLQDVLTEYA